MPAAYDSKAYSTNATNEWTHTTSASALNNAVLLVFAGTTNNSEAPTTVTCDGTAMTNIANSGSVETDADSMGVWAYAIALGDIGASQNYSLIVSGGAGNWACESVVVSNAQQTINASYTAAGYTHDGGGVSTPSVSLAVPSNGLVLNNIATWNGSDVGLASSGSGTILNNDDTSGYNGGNYGTQYTTSAGSLSWTFTSTDPTTICSGSWGVPAAASSPANTGFLGLMGV
jgi:hypothetical protein